MELQEVKRFLKMDDINEDDLFIQSLIEASKHYLKNATGKTFSDNNELVKLLRLVLINEWFSNRSFVQEGKVSEKVRFTIQSILMQLQYCDGDE